MVVTVHAQHVELSGALKRYALEQLHEPLEQIWNKSGSQLEIYLRDLRGTKGGVDQECRAVFYIPNGPKMVITEVTDDMRKSIHQARKRLMRRARQYIGQKVVGNRYPKKYYLTEVEDKTLLRRYPRSEEIHGGNETIR